jgi:hypothetical protein
VLKVFVFEAYINILSFVEGLLAVAGLLLSFVMKLFRGRICSPLFYIEPLGLGRETEGLRDEADAPTSEVGRDEENAGGDWIMEPFFVVVCYSSSPRLTK